MREPFIISSFAKKSRKKWICFMRIILRFIRNFFFWYAHFHFISWGPITTTLSNMYLIKHSYGQVTISGEVATNLNVYFVIYCHCHVRTSQYLWYHALENGTISTYFDDLRPSRPGLESRSPVSNTRYVYIQHT